VRVDRSAYGTLPSGERVDAFTLANDRGIEARIMTYGGTILALSTPDRAGTLGDIVLGFDRFQDYLDDSRYHAVIVGRYANRIAWSQFTIDGETFHVTPNDGPHHLHGGRRGFNSALWTGESFQHPDAVGVILRLTSEAGADGYPGRVDATVTYSLTDNGELIVDYEAVVDAPTPVNLTQHSYFNLTAQARDILGHRLTIDAWRYTPVGPGLIPTGELASVENTPLDFRRPIAIGERIDDSFEQLAIAGGYDHNYVLDRATAAPDTLARAAHVEEPESGRTLTVYTTEPGVQLYTGNWLVDTVIGKAGRPNGRRMGFCLETQHFPDSPNKPRFPSTIVRPGERYRSRTVFAFGILD
jgi:aldose 1-epimerase